MARWSLPRQWRRGYSVWTVLWRSLQHQQNDGELNTVLCAIVTFPSVVAFWGTWVNVRLYKPSVLLTFCCPGFLNCLHNPFSLSPRTTSETAFKKNYYLLRISNIFSSVSLDLRSGLLLQLPLCVLYDFLYRELEFCFLRMIQSMRGNFQITGLWVGRLVLQLSLVNCYHLKKKKKKVSFLVIWFQMDFS